MLRFGDFEFRPDTGDLRRTSGPSEGIAVRLPPQPARLLELLLDRRGALLDREEIRAELWPDTQVDVDQSLAFCVRQLRAALGDSAATPAYIETLPRRGFRLLVPVSETPEEIVAAAERTAAARMAVPAPLGVSPPRRGRLARAAWLAGAAAILVIAALAAPRLVGTPRQPTRLAIMPFELAAGANANDGSRLARISEWLVVELAREPTTRLEVVGPRTTAVYHGEPFPDLASLARDLDVDFVINCRYLRDTAEATLVVELIRLGDGAHVWVERFEGHAPWREVAEAVHRGVRGALTTPP